MSADEFINRAIDLGRKKGVDGLDVDQRLVFLISETEVLCDMEGIDSFLDKYSPAWLSETANAFREIGANEIADCLNFLNTSSSRDDANLNWLNDLVTKRADYNYDAIQRVIDRRLRMRAEPI